MKKILLIIISFIILSAHDMFLRMDSFFLDPNTSSTIHLYNGTFNESDNIITRDRMLDASIVHSGIRNLIDTSQWSELDSSITVLHFKTGEPGTYVAGVSTRARDIELEAKSFNEYLEHDGVLDILDQRKKDGTMDQSAIEKYSKHVKIIFQVGEERSEDWKTVLDYPIEFVPLTNPYDLEKGDYMEMQLLRNGIPLSNQLVYGGFSDGGHSHTHGGDHEPHHHDEKSMRTDAKGMFKFKLDHGGKWYVRTIHMVLSEEPGLTHESNWAT
ncbi:MAG: DUF4198 domain-containing protein, partial [Saprospiraceae bacterium]|nr:DUF4198 domain-containing protein [Saprospiraceae bacterium]